MKKSHAKWFILPAEILLALITITSFYIKFRDNYPLTWATPITLLIILAAYFYGKILQGKDKFDF